MLRYRAVEPLRINAWIFSGLLLLSGCSSKHSFSFKSNPVREEKYSSNTISLNLDDALSQYQIEWMHVDNTWYCKLIANNLLSNTPALVLRVITEKEAEKYTFTARKGGDVFRLSERDTAQLLEQLTHAESAQLFIGSYSKQITCDEFIQLVEKAKKNHARFIEL